MLLPRLLLGIVIAALVPMAGCRFDVPNAEDYLGESSTTTTSSGPAGEPSSSGPPADGTTEAATGSGTTEAVTGSGTTEAVVTSDSGTTDSGTTSDSSTTETVTTTDSGTTEAVTTSDSGTTDSGTTDSGTTDSGTTDSGTTDSGTTDSGTTVCGDGMVEGMEECEDVDLAGQTCVSQGFAGGTLACTGACTFDTSGCYFCGDGSIDPGEQCDAPALGGLTCASFDFAGGNLACTGACTYDTSDCYFCGDGVANPGEDCDDLDFNGQTCATQGFGGGLLACNDTCAFDTSDCYVCGDGVANPGEDCDGLDLIGQTCAGQGFSGGYLGCDGACNYDTSGCCISGTIIDFGNPVDVAGWMVTDLNGTGAGWGLYSQAPQNQSAGPVPFPNAPVYGTDGNRSMPYPGGHDESSQVVTNTVEIPLEVSFLSWHVDEGSDPYDTKLIEISVDGGLSWTSLVDCTFANTHPFCDFVNDGRPADAWDFIALDTSPWAGQLGQLRFSYDTIDSCCEFERGWFIDDLSLCAAP